MFRVVIKIKYLNFIFNYILGKYYIKCIDFGIDLGYLVLLLYKCCLVL